MSKKTRTLPPNAPGTESSGVVLIDKPAGWTSHDVVSRTRKLAGTRKVGHAGTLDPMATGLLVIGFNKATRLLTHITGADKTYTATIRLGQTTTTDDAEGEIIDVRPANAVTPELLAAEIGQLTGEIMQVPSTVSAIKIDGKRAYQRARDGEDVEIPARPVTIHRFEITDTRRADDGKTIDVDVVVKCSSGTYIRALARDLGEALDTGGHLTVLRRTEVGPFTLDQASTLEELEKSFSYTELSQAASGLFPVRELSTEEARELSFGRRIEANGDDQLYAAQDPLGDVVALIKDHEQRGTVQAKPELVFKTEQGAS